MNIFRPIILNSLLLVLFCFASSEAQQKQNGSEPTGLALEVLYYKGMPPAYMPVPGPDSQPKGSWFARFRRVASSQPVDPSLAVRAVNIISVKEKEGDIVRVQVSVFLGARFHDKEEHVATFRLREAQSIRVDELARFGVEPIEITLIRPPALLPRPPEVVNKADSIEVTGIETNNSTLPSYRLSLGNRSSKNLVALQIDVHVGEEKRLMSQPMGKEGHPLIKAGAIFQTNVPGVKQATMTRQGYMPDSPQGQTILIGTAVFDDGTFEGDPRNAAHIIARVIGQKMQLTDVVSLLDNTVESSDADTPTLGRLRQQVSSLKEDVEMKVVDELLKGISSVESSERSALRVRFQVTLHSIKKQLLDAIDRFEKDQNASPDRNSFKTWLNTTRERYKQWLSRLRYRGKTSRAPYGARAGASYNSRANICKR